MTDGGTENKVSSPNKGASLIDWERAKIRQSAIGNGGSLYSLQVLTIFSNSNAYGILSAQEVALAMVKSPVLRYILLVQTTEIRTP